MLHVHIINILAVEELQRREELRMYNIERHIMRDASDPFSLSNFEFDQLFRLNKDMARDTLNSIIQHLMRGSIPPAIKFFATLHFYASGSYQKVSGQNFNLSVSQQSMSKIIVEVTNALITELCRFPIALPEKNEIKHRFMEATYFPGVIGAIDGTHVPLLKPHEQEYNYFNRKGYHSKNVQIICDFDLNILNINARFGGAAHDSFIWRQSRVKAEMERCYNEGDRNTWLIGDSGYPQEPWLMTPVENPLPGSPESVYNQSHVRARNCVERCIGILKGRFRCLMLERKMRYSPLKVGNIIIACSILHNICLSRELPINFNMPQPEDHNLQHYNPFLNHQEGMRTRANLIALYFD